MFKFLGKAGAVVMGLSMIGWGVASIGGARSAAPRWHRRESRREAR